MIEMTGQLRREPSPQDRVALDRTKESVSRHRYRASGGVTLFCRLSGSRSEGTILSGFARETRVRRHRQSPVFSFPESLDSPLSEFLNFRTASRDGHVPGADESQDVMVIRDLCPRVWPVADRRFRQAESLWPIRLAGVAQLAEHHVAIVVVEGSNPFTRSCSGTTRRSQSATFARLQRQNSRSRSGADWPACGPA